jgi:hypothetical protein
MPVGKPQIETAHRHDGQEHGGAEHAAHVAAGFALPRCHLVFDLGRFCRHRDLSSRFVSGAQGRIVLRLKHEGSDGSSREDQDNARQKCIVSARCENLEAARRKAGAFKRLGCGRKPNRQRSACNAKARRDPWLISEDQSVGHERWTLPMCNDGGCVHYFIPCARRVRQREYLFDLSRCPGPMVDGRIGPNFVNDQS